jgi:hypothetical protein
LDRKADFLAAYEAAEEVKIRLKIFAEVRLLEQAAARLAQVVKTDVPAPLSHASRKAAKAANTRWTRAAVQ